LRELEFQAGLVLGTYGVNADLKSIQNFLNKTSIDQALKEASHIIFRTHFIRKALTKDDAEDAIRTGVKKFSKSIDKMKEPKK